MIYCIFIIGILLLVAAALWVNRAFEQLGDEVSAHYAVNPLSPEAGEAADDTAEDDAQFLKKTA